MVGLIEHHGPPNGKTSHIYILGSQTKQSPVTTNPQIKIKTDQSKFLAHLYILYLLYITCYNSVMSIWAFLHDARLRPEIPLKSVLL